MVRRAGFFCRLLKHTTKKREPSQVHAFFYGAKLPTGLMCIRLFGCCHRCRVIGVSAVEKQIEQHRAE